MMRCVCGLALLALACTAPPAAERADPIAAEMLCDADADAASAMPTTADPKACAAATRKRLEYMQRTVLKRWPYSSDERPDSTVQLQFSLDAEGRVREACVLGGTGASEARAALAALATFKPRKPLSAAERCLLGQPLISTFTTERRQ